MKRNISLFFGIMTLALVAVGASAQDTFGYSNGDIRSAVLDDSTIEYTRSSFGVRFQHTSSDPAIYLNSVEISGGTTWNPLINLNSSLAYLGFTNGTFGQNTYALGTAITQDVDWDFDEIARRTGVVDSSVAAGIYDFNVKIRGGASASATSILSDLVFRIEVVPSITATAVATLSPNSIGWGENTTASVTFTNTGTRDIRANTWYVSAYQSTDPLPPTDLLDFVDFRGEWFDQTLNSGASRTDLHSEWKARTNQTPGMYEGNIGIIGGLYQGDAHSWRASNATLEVVPEPTTMVALGLGLAGIVRRRKA